MSIDNGYAQTALDARGLAQLKHAARQDKTDVKTLEKVAGQFEALFLNMMLKSMRSASLGPGLFDSSQSELYRDMADQQLSIDIAATRGLGLRDVILRQLQPSIATTEQRANLGQPEQAEALSMDTVTTRPTLVDQERLRVTVNPNIDSQINTDNNVSAANASPIPKLRSPQQFIEQLWSMAQQAASKIKVPPEVLISQAALETGWGQHILQRANGQSSYNLFNIKADPSWQGEQVSLPVVEYRDGMAVSERAKFRVYDSYQASFDDYIAFLQTQPRYQQALAQNSDPEAFIDALHRAGYATDPDYADKIKRIMESDKLVDYSQQMAMGDRG